jgi:hypothetical protein
MNARPKGEEFLCECGAFVWWYTDGHGWTLLRVCRCGHPSSEHIKESGSCTGVSVGA